MSSVNYELYTWPTPNGRKVSIMLEELGVSYQVIPIDITSGKQNEKAFKDISPNGKIPILKDLKENLYLMESGVILHYLAKKYKAASSFQEEYNPTTVDQEQFSPNNLPNIYQSLSPIVVPILLMATGSIVQFISPNLGAFKNMITLIGSPEAALFIGVLLAMRLNSKKQNNFWQFLKK